MGRDSKRLSNGAPKSGKMAKWMRFSRNAANCSGRVISTNETSIRGNFLWNACSNGGNTAVESLGMFAIFNCPLSLLADSRA